MRYGIVLFAVAFTTLVPPSPGLAQVTVHPAVTEAGRPALVVSTPATSSCSALYGPVADGAPSIPADPHDPPAPARLAVHYLGSTATETPYRYSVTCPGVGSATGVVDAAGAAAPANGVLVSGTIRNAGSTVAGAAVLLWKQSDLDDGTRPARLALSDARGRFSVRVPVVSFARHDERASDLVDLLPGFRRSRWRERLRPRATSLLATAITQQGGSASGSLSTLDPWIDLSVPAAVPGCPAVTCSVNESRFIATWTSELPTTGWLVWGSDPNNLGDTACDLREGGAVPCSLVRDTHIVEVLGLLASTTYYFRVVEGGQPRGDLCTVTTGPSLGLPSLPDRRFGKVLHSNGIPALGALVHYVVTRGTQRSAPLCTTVRDRRGFWFLDDRNAARTEDLRGPFRGRTGDIEMISADAGAGGFAEQQVPYASPNPVPDMVLGAPLLPECIDLDGDGFVVCDGCEAGPGTQCGDCDERYATCTTDCTDGDGDGLALCAGDCDDHSRSCTLDCTDFDTDGVAACAGDCDDRNGAIHPGALESCDGVNNDCDATTADGSGETWLDTPCDGPDSDLCTEGAFVCRAGLQVCTDDTGDDVEGVSVPGSCSDRVDNDCDGSTDAEEPECASGFMPVAPVAGSVFPSCSSPPTFRWSPGAHTAFRVLLSPNADLSPPTRSSGEAWLGTADWTPSPAEWLDILGFARSADTTVYWAVVAGSGPTSPSSSFVIPAQVPPVALSPPDGLRVQATDLPPLFRWEPGPCSSVFQLEFASHPAFTPPTLALPDTGPISELDWTPPPSDWLPSGRLADLAAESGGMIYWRVRATDPLGRSATSVPRSIQVVGDLGTGDPPRGGSGL